MARTIALSTLAVAALLASSAQAQSLTGLEVLQQFSQVSLGDTMSSSETIGRAWVGGNVNSGLYSMSSSSPTSAFAGLTVLGNASNFQSGYYGVSVGGNVANGVVKNSLGASYVAGNSSNTNYDNQAYITGSLQGNLNKGGYAGSLADSGSHVNGGGLTAASQATIDASKAAAVTLDSMRSTLTGLSSGLSKLQGNSSVTITDQGVIFEAAPVNGVAVFDLTALAYPTTASLLQLDDVVFGARSVKFNLNGATSVIVNSDNGAISTAANFANAAQVGGSIIWNLYNAGSVSIGTQWGGSVLATNATFTNGNSIEGGVYASSFAQYGEIHLVPYTGGVPTAAVPEPETVAMLLAGLGMIGFIGRRRQKAAAAAR